MLKIIIDIVASQDLTDYQLAGLKQLFDREYLEDYGPWNVECPYGYAPQDIHILAYVEEKLVGHMGSQLRFIKVGDQECLVAGIGGVLIAPEFRGLGLATSMMQKLTNHNRDDLQASFSYLGCRLEVVPFYEACGFHRIEREECWIDRVTGAVRSEFSSTIMIASGRDDWTVFPDGKINLLGRTW